MPVNFDASRASKENIMTELYSKQNRPKNIVQDCIARVLEYVSLLFKMVFWFNIGYMLKKNVSCILVTSVYNHQIQRRKVPV
jgi:hypothetical protein